MFIILATDQLSVIENPLVLTMFVKFSILKSVNAWTLVYLHEGNYLYLSCINDGQGLQW